MLHRRLLGLLLFVLVLVLLEQTLGLRSHLNLPYLQQQLHGHPLTGLALFVLLFAVGNDVRVQGARPCGSVLIENMMVAGR